MVRGHHCHQVAFLRLQQTWSRLDRLAALRPRLENERAQPSLEVNRWMARGPAWRWLAAGIAIATLTTGIALFVPGSGGWEIHSTNTGGFERIPLQDGSILELNTQTEVAVELSARTRIVRLIRGEANFKVAHDARRPFIVTVDDTAVRAVGTQFNVRRLAQTIEVMVMDGRVAIGSPDALANPAMQLPRSAPLLQAGSIAIAAPSGLVIREVGEAEAGRRLAWQVGMLSFDGQTLAEVIEEFGRYDRRQVVIDPKLASLRIGGQFRASNLNGFVSVLERRFKVQVSIAADRIVLRSTEPTVEPSSPRQCSSTFRPSPRAVLVIRQIRR